MIQEAPELWIAGSISDAAMERKIFIDPVFAPLERAIDRLQAIDNIADLGRRGALGGQACSFHFDAGTQLHDLNDFADRRQTIEIDTEGPARILGNKGSDTLTGYHQSLGPQRGHRFAHHGTAYASRRNHLLLGW